MSTAGWENLGHPVLLLDCFRTVSSALRLIIYYVYNIYIQNIYRENMEKQIRKDEKHGSQHTLQRIASVKNSNMYLRHVAANILCSTIPTVLNQGKLFCVCLIHININTAYTFLPLIGGQTVFQVHLSSLSPEKKYVYDSKSQTVETCQVSSVCESSDCSPREKFLCICQTQ